MTGSELWFEPVARIQCEAAELLLHPQGYVVIDQVPRITQTWDTALEMLRGSAELAGGKRASLVVLTNESRTTRDARRAFADVGGQLLGACGLVIKSKVSEMTGNFFLRIQKPSFPMRLFQDRAAAEAWALDHLGKPLGPDASKYLSP